MDKLFVCKSTNTILNKIKVLGNNGEESKIKLKEP